MRQLIADTYTPISLSFQYACSRKCQLINNNLDISSVYLIYLASLFHNNEWILDLKKVYFEEINFSCTVHVRTILLLFEAPPTNLFMPHTISDRDFVRNYAFAMFVLVGSARYFMHKFQMVQKIVAEYTLKKFQLERIVDCCARFYLRKSVKSQLFIPFLQKKTRSRKDIAKDGIKMSISFNHTNKNLALKFHVYHMFLRLLPCLIN